MLSSKNENREKHLRKSANVSTLFYNLFSKYLLLYIKVISPCCALNRILDFVLNIYNVVQK